MIQYDRSVGSGTMGKQSKSVPAMNCRAVIGRPPGLRKQRKSVPATNCRAIIRYPSGTEIAMIKECPLVTKDEKILNYSHVRTVR